MKRRPTILLAILLGGGLLAIEATAQGGDKSVRREARLRRQAASSAAEFEPLLSGTIGAVSLPVPQTVTSPSVFSLTIDGDFDLGGFVFKDGVPFLHTDGSYNTALGLNSLISTTPGSPYPFSGNYNTALGESALRNNTSGLVNTATGYGALYANMTGSRNTANGYGALIASTSGHSNTAIGYAALFRSTVANGNTAIGDYALYYNTEGSGNTALGYRAGYNLGYGVTTPFTSMSQNIFIGNEGETDEAHVIRIGSDQNTTFIAGIDDQTLTVSATPVCVEPTGQLGRCPTPSSRQYKHDIKDMGAGSEPVLELRPVTFRFTKEIAGQEEALQFGLIAEEVAGVFPELVDYDEEGRPEAVKYRFLSSLLLNELQKQATEIQEMRARLERLETVEPGYRRTGLRAPP